MQTTQTEMRISRETILRSLETAEPGLSSKETLEQSNCFILTQGKVISYNEELSIQGPSGLSPDFSGAVRADKLLDMLRRFTEDEVRVVQSDGNLTVYGKKRKFGVRMEEEIHLPYSSIDSPDEFKALPDEFSEAVQMVATCCATKDDAAFNLTCLNIAPKWIESCDDMRICRWRIKTTFKEPVMFKYTAGKPISRMGVTHASQTKGWIHFRNARDFVLSVRKYQEEYPSEYIEPWLAEEGKVVSLPKGLKEACDKAQVFTLDNGSDSNTVNVTLKATKVTVRGDGPLGWYEENAKVSWDGPDVSFWVTPVILSELVDKYNEVILTPRSIKIEGTNYIYCTRLTVPANGESKPE